MPEVRVKETLYHTADRAKLVKEGDADAAFLVAREGTVLPEAEARRLGLKASQYEDREPADRVREEEEAIEAAKARGAYEEAAIRERNLARVRMEAEALEQGEPVVASGGTSLDAGAEVEYARREEAADAAPATRAASKRGGGK